MRGGYQWWSAIDWSDKNGIASVQDDADALKLWDAG